MAVGGPSMAGRCVATSASVSAREKTSVHGPVWPKRSGFHCSGAAYAGVNIVACPSEVAPPACRVAALRTLAMPKSKMRTLSAPPSSVTKMLSGLRSQ